MDATSAFWSFVDIGSDDACWSWRGRRLHDGRGIFRYRSDEATAPRWAWMLHNGLTIPKGLEACHSCDNPNCVNPRHIWIGSHADNMRDASRKNRLSRQGNVVTKAKTHCPQGHPYDEANTYWYRGHRQCLTCRRSRTRPNKNQTEETAA